MSKATAADAAEDFGGALGVLLRSYVELVTPRLGEFPHGERGYQTLCEVIRGRQPSQAALAARLGIDRTVMTYLIDDLVEAGLVERRLNPADRRQRQVVATTRGRKALSALCERVAEAERAVLSGLDAPERETFRRLLMKAASGGGGAAHSLEACEAITDALAR
ncbi:MarR family winged helix-turn-helix transcriptional regulator [Dactylosporangium sp. CA-092794]|uniref:MarR family winged helix-turn-helix transcriptional regulator n=1 Tax=Dactylosporangium sp. CA-092794 TaxID=3239929 RepID=UPI003D8E21F8